MLSTSKYKTIDLGVCRTMIEQMIKNKNISIMKNKLLFKFDEKADKIELKNFFGQFFDLAPFELAYLLMEVEREFNISIPDTYLIDPGVKTIDNFTKYIIANQKGLIAIGDRS